MCLQQINWVCFGLMFTLKEHNVKGIVHFDLDCIFCLCNGNHWKPKKYLLLCSTGVIQGLNEIRVYK